MAIFSGTSSSELISPPFVSGSVIRNPAGSSPAGSVDDTFNGSGGNDSIDGGVGNGFDILDYTALGIAVTVTLTGPYVGTVTKGALGTDTFTNIDRITGTAAADTFIAFAGLTSGVFAIQFRGLAGNDTLNGAKNTFYMADYFNSPAAVTVRLQDTVDGSGNLIGSAADGFGTTDSLVNVERVRGSAFNDTITGSFTDNIFDATVGSDTYNGRGGFDSVWYSGLSTAITVTALAPDPGLFGTGNFTVSKGASGNDTLDGVNGVRGSSAGDVMNGITATYSWFNYQLRGGGGNDTINGFGNTNNEVNYRNSASAVAVDLLAGTATDGEGGTDVLIDVRSVDGSAFADTLLGSNASDLFRMGVGEVKTIDGRGGANRLTFRGADSVAIDLGSAGTAAAGGFGGFIGTVRKADGTLLANLSNINQGYGGGGNDTITGNANNNTLSGGQGNNTLNGGAGQDTAAFAGFSSIGDTTDADGAPARGAVVNLADGITGTATNSWGGTDTLLSIESASGSTFADQMTGAVLADGSRSFLRGRGGNDTLSAPAFNTKITADYSDALTGVTVNLKTGVTADDGFFGGTDTLVNIQSARGSDFVDSLTGSARNDVLEGRAGNDVLIGEAGLDTAIFSGNRAATSFAYNADGSITATGPDGVDTLRGIETARFADGSQLALRVEGHDLTNDGATDLLWRNTADGALVIFTLDGAGGITTAPGLGQVTSDWQIVATGDLNSDGRADLVWQNSTTGLTTSWLMNGSTITGDIGYGSGGPDWRIQRLADFNGDGTLDLLWRNSTTGAVVQYMLDAAGGVVSAPGVAVVGLDWQVVATGDLNGDGKADLVWQNTSGLTTAWLMDGSTILGSIGYGDPGAAWRIQGLADFNGDGTKDLLWRNTATGDVVEFLLDANGNVTSAPLVAVVGNDWRITGIADLNRDAKADILWQNVSGETTSFLMDGAAIIGGVYYGNPGAAWTLLA